MIRLEAYDVPGKEYWFVPATGEYRLADVRDVVEVPARHRSGFGATIRLGGWLSRRLFVAIYLEGQGLFLQLGQQRFSFDGRTIVAKASAWWRYRVVRVARDGKVVYVVRYWASWQETDSLFSGDLLTRAVEISSDDEAEAFAICRWQAERDGRRLEDPAGWSLLEEEIKKRLTKRQTILE